MLKKIASVNTYEDFQDNELILKFMLINISSGIAMGMMSFIIPVYAINLKATSTEIGLINGISE